MAYTWLTPEGAPLHISLAAGALTLSFAGRSNLSFDGEGRLVGAWYDHITYRRGLDNRVLAKWLDPGRPPQRRRALLSTDRRQALVERAYSDAYSVLDRLRQNALRTAPTPPAFVSHAAAWLERIAAWSFDRLEGEAGRFCAIYKPVSILPPDQYLALVLQATEGCSYNQCTFCTFYRDRPFRIKSPGEFEEHVRQVQNFLGRGLVLRRSVFLADANAVIMPNTRLLPLLQAVNAAFTITPPGLEQSARRAWEQAHPAALEGIYAFISAPDALRKTPQEFAALRTLGLRRLYVGLETGHDPLRRFLHKPGSAEDALAAVQAMKAGGLGVGVIFMTGIGGQAFRAPHFTDTLALVERMPLDSRDLLYISPFVAGADSPYVADAAAAGLGKIDGQAAAQEEERFKYALQPFAKARGVRISHYDVREFIY